jgi:drug/metabolite transporter (DMT)-like permease
MTLIALVAVALVRHTSWRRWYVVVSVGLGLLTLLTIEALTQLTPWQKAELFSVLAGLVLLVVGHIGWRRERERETDLVSFALGLGSLMVGVPLIIATIHHRYEPHFSWPNELGLLVFGLVLLATGFAFELRATTLTGAAMTTLYVVTLPLYARGLLEHVQTAAILLAVGGGLIFGVGIVLAVWRDRLLALPARVRNREGIFRVLSWR